MAQDIEIEGDLLALASREFALSDPALIVSALSAGIRTAAHQGIHELKAAGCTDIEYRGRVPGRHSILSDLIEVDFHYGLDSAFYERLLGPSLTYSCAIYERDTDSLESAQHRKHALIGRKLGLDVSSTVLDIGCGWGSFLLDSSRDFGCRGIGVTASVAQAKIADKRTIDTPGVHIVYADYRQALPIAGATAACSIGMYEHVGARRSALFFRRVRASVPRGARYLNQSIIRRADGPRRFRSNSFAQRYIFPNAQLLPLSVQLRELEQAGFRIISVEAYGESYAQTIRAWLKNLETHRDTCVERESEARVRAWQMYLTGALRRFEDRSIDLTQVLAEAC